jgi:hypothetical protein
MSLYQSIKRSPVPAIYSQNSSDPVTLSIMQALFLLAREVKDCHNAILSFQGFPGNGVGSFGVTLPAPMPNAAYSVAICPDYNTTVWTSGKSATAFTCNFGTVVPAPGHVIDFLVIA